MKIFTSFLITCLTLSFVWGQEIKVEFDKNHDFTGYKTFSFGSSEILTPKDQRKVSDATVDGWIKSAVTQELKGKGLQPLESGGDLVITYAFGTLSRSTTQSVGPAMLTPGADATNQRMYDYQETSLIVDMNNKNNFLVWRVNAVTTVNATDGKAAVEQIVAKGFKKYSMKPKKKK